MGLVSAEGIGPFEYLQSRGYVQDVSDPDGLRQAFAAGRDLGDADLGQPADGLDRRAGGGRRRERPGAAPP